MAGKKILLFSGLLILTTGILLFLFDPESAWFAPKCPLFAFTGIQCPACGTQRAIHHFLHLDFAGAFRHNPFLVVSMPYVVSCVTVYALDRRHLPRLRRFCYHPAVVNVYAGLILLWWILRNVFSLTP